MNRKAMPGPAGMFPCRDVIDFRELLEAVAEALDTREMSIQLEGNGDINGKVKNSDFFEEGKKVPGQVLCHTE